MEDKCRKYWRPCVPCPTGQALPSGATCPPSVPPTDAPSGSAGGITFGAAAHTPEPAGTGVPTPRFDVPGPLMKTVRDPALSLSALSGVDPSGPVMVEVPLVLNNSAFTPAQALTGWRIGYAGRYVRGDEYEPAEHSASFTRALDKLRQAGAQLVALDAEQVDDSLQFSMHNEIDRHATENRLDALVSEGRSAAFHAACRSGYPGLFEPLEEGNRLWFYSAHWMRDHVRVLAQSYRLLLQEPVTLQPTPWVE
ncbi:hypothetical protein FX985_05166 [Pseudomonas extremaustralis]|uniref:Amidase domain-containing protein n=2 Tax=Pseudomonas extremaustralis TaxID=359110 RepID=A0A5M9IRS9_9PSED|nr:amidase family protein [Pseudomonas extremaustralis]KAA8558803.1 hypothetical protein FX985_05166 [Pseudomonas extremaustralis]